MYARCFKRAFDFCLSLLALLVLSPLLLLLTVTGAIAMRGDPFFRQPRPGKNERIFYLIKFRSMNGKRDAAGALLPDEARLTRYGRFLRKTSLDELPSLFNVLAGQLAIVGPRPQLVRDMVFMSAAERRRHTVRQGLTGLAQCNGRNNVTWEQKFAYDLAYIDRITLWGDVKIIFKTLFAVLRREGVNSENMATAQDFGDYLLETGKIDRAAYEAGQQEAQRLLTTFEKKKRG